jgi:calmodulin
MKEMREAYICFDKEEGDNFVTAKTFGTVLRALGQNPTETELKGILAKLGDKISWDEFLALFPTLDYKDDISEDDLKDMWGVFADEDSVSADDFKKGLQSMGDKITDDEFSKLVSQQGLSGSVTFDQFKAIMTSQNNVMNP